MPRLTLIGLSCDGVSDPQASGRLGLDRPLWPYPTGHLSLDLRRTAVSNSLTTLQFA